MNVEQKKKIRNIVFIAVAAFAAWYLNLDLDNGGNSHETSSDSRSENGSALGGEFVLALSWQSAFCEKKPNKPECRSQRAGRFDTENLVLHGLWPQPQNNVYCGNLAKSGSWSRLPKLDLSNALRKELETKMPGYRSYLHRHEWVKHGTCAKGMTPQSYFDTSLSMLDQVNNSSLKTYFAQNIGREIRLQDARARFEADFGKGSGDRLMFFCNRDQGRNLISEIRISLAGRNGSAFADLASAVQEASPLRSRCKTGIVDAPGLQ